MKKTILLFALMFVFAALVSNAQITNGGFETWTSTNPDGWVGTKTHTTGLTIHKVTDTDSVHGGVNACGLKNTTTAHRRFTTAPTSITNGTSYELSFWVKGSGTIRTSMFTGAMLSGSFGYLDYGTYITLSGSWEQITRSLVADTTTSAAEFIIDLGVAANIVVDDVTVTTSGVGINDIPQTNLNIYPNPASSVLNINNMENISVIKISNILGETVNTIKVSSINTVVNVSDLSSGVYFITLIDNNGILNTKKFYKE